MGWIAALSPIQAVRSGRDPKVCDDSISPGKGAFSANMRCGKLGKVEIESQ
jgi:hypothetical protein